MKFLAPILGVATLSVAACAQERSAASPASPQTASASPYGSIPRPPRVPAQYSEVSISRPIVALTFDDGPHPQLTPKLLDILRDNGVRATFFVVGRNVAAHPDIAHRIIAEGHEIANHSWSHPALTGLGTTGINREISSTSDAIQRATGRQPTLMRPPYGAVNDRVRQNIMRDNGLDVVLWSVDPLDWKRPGAEVVRQRLVAGATPGGILLAHDIHPGTVEAVPGVIRDLKAKGYGFATVSQLLAMQETKAPAAIAARAGVPVHGPASASAGRSVVQ